MCLAFDLFFCQVLLGLGLAAGHHQGPLGQC